LMSANGNWSLAPAFDITFCDGPGGYHQMDVMGEALTIEREHLMNLGIREAELEESRVNEIIDRIASVATTFSKKCHELLPGKVTRDTLSYIQTRIDENISGIKS
ncbi:TPA: type II toxin-antitoxin system HipA family toxin, partial [Raoultella ornithinolytica]